MKKVQPAPFKLPAIGASRTGTDAQKTLLTTDETIPIPKLNFDPDGELKITASPLANVMEMVRSPTSELNNR
jgi:hypothetical protein